MFQKMDPVAAATLFLLPIGYIWNGLLTNYPGVNGAPRMAMLAFLVGVILFNRTAFYERRRLLATILELLILWALAGLVGADILAGVLTYPKILALRVLLRGSLCLFGYGAICGASRKEHAVCRMLLYGLGAYFVIAPLVSMDLSVKWVILLATATVTAARWNPRKRA